MNFKNIYIYEVKGAPLRHADAKGERKYSSYSFLTPTLDGEMDKVTFRPPFTLGERSPGTHWIGGWVDLRTGLETEAREEILCLYRGSNPGCPVCSQTLYLLTYPSS
jgi:hypothetical protein